MNLTRTRFGDRRSGTILVRVVGQAAERRTGQSLTPAASWMALAERKPDSERVHPSEQVEAAPPSGPLSRQKSIPDC
ncbi:MAG: hypothetical protein R3212_11230 [Xanthomonadales bacterium]|nr:hypothetical protein [Xanthomonadales bacterium]